MKLLLLLKRKNYQVVHEFATKFMEIFLKRNSNGLNCCIIIIIKIPINQFSMKKKILLKKFVKMSRFLKNVPIFTNFLDSAELVIFSQN